MKKIFDESIDNTPIKLKDLTLHPDNPRKNYDKNELKLLANSLDSSGQLNPIIVDEYGYILSGNRRYLASKTLEWEYLKGNIKTKLNNFEKKAILISTNLTQLKINAWQNREIIGNTYWNEFLTDYEHKGEHDKGISTFSKSMGLSKGHARKIIEIFDKKNEDWMKLLRKNNIPSGVADSIVGFPYERRLPITKEVIYYRNNNLNKSRDDLKIFVRSLNREMRINKSKKYNISSFGILKRRVKTLITYLNKDHVEKMTNDQRKELKQLIKNIVIPFYEKL